MVMGDWKRIVDEMAAQGVSWVLIRGGEPFLYPGMIELLEYLRAKGLPTSVDGPANFCVDFPDYSIGNVKAASIEELWNAGPAARFREYRRKRPLAVCHRCGAKYMSAPRTPCGSLNGSAEDAPAPGR
jgi:MoaA/NifB/PqqE/SkfB family radical SAM enzyme